MCTKSGGPMTERDTHNLPRPATPALVIVRGGPFKERGEWDGSSYAYRHSSFNAETSIQRTQWLIICLRKHQVPGFPLSPHPLGTRGFTSDPHVRTCTPPHHVDAKAIGHSSFAVLSGTTPPKWPPLKPWGAGKCSFPNSQETTEKASVKRYIFLRGI